MWTFNRKSKRRFKVEFTTLEKFKKGDFTNEEIYCNEEELSKVMDEFSQREDIINTQVLEVLEVDYE